ncbi:MAG: DUF4304 domain-containing protein [Bacteroidetes bacterium]|nr:DUF4304 domain-containing protein [Bacteroidota bacterium]
MTAKDLQKIFIKDCLKPLLKEHDYKTIGQLWFKKYDNFTVLIQLQNSAWNDADSVDFCFNIGISTAIIDKPSFLRDVLQPPLREPAFLNAQRNKHQFRSRSPLGYKITLDTDLALFISEFEQDWEGEILPLLNSLTTLHAWKNLYKKYPSLYIGPIKNVLESII